MFQKGAVRASENQMFPPQKKIRAINKRKNLQFPLDTPDRNDSAYKRVLSQLFKYFEKRGDFPVNSLPRQALCL